MRGIYFSSMRVGGRNYILSLYPLRILIVKAQFLGWKSSQFRGMWTRKREERTSKEYDKFLSSCSSNKLDPCRILGKKTWIRVCGILIQIILKVLRVGFKEIKRTFIVGRMRRNDGMSSLFQRLLSFVNSSKSNWEEGFSQTKAIRNRFAENCETYNTYIGGKWEERRTSKWWWAISSSIDILRAPY